MDLCAPRNMTITISVTKGGLSNPLVYQLTKARTSIGRAGGGADIEIDDPQVSALHCAVGVTQDMVRLCDLDSANGTYLNGQRVEAVELEHLTEFCLGSTWLVVTIVPKHFSVSEHAIPAMLIVRGETTAKASLVAKSDRSRLGTTIPAMNKVNTTSISSRTSEKAFCLFMLFPFGPSLRRPFQIKGNHLQRPVRR